MKQLRKLTSENARLKKLYAEPLLHTDIIKEALAKSNRAISFALDGVSGNRLR